MWKRQLHIDTEKVIEGDVSRNGKQNRVKEVVDSYRDPKIVKRKIGNEMKSFLI